MGIGDAKLVMLAGAWFGWPGAAFVLFAGAIQATVGAIVVLLVRGRDRRARGRARRPRRAAAGRRSRATPRRSQALAEDPLANPPDEGVMAARMPFGPFLCLAIIEWMLGGDWIRERLGASSADGPRGAPAGEGKPPRTLSTQR